MVSPYQKFYEVLKTPATRKSYQIHMKKFFDYAHTDYDGLVKLPKNEIDDLIFNYIVSLKIKTEKTGKPSPNSYNPMLYPIQTFLEQNDILLNWKKLKRYYPAKVPVSNQLAYQTVHIQKMLKLVNCPRDVSFVHLLASTGIRIGAVYDLTCSDLHYVQDGAVITIYKDSTNEYRVCLTPEATTALKTYLATRRNTKAHDPLFTVRNNSRKLTDGSIKDIMKRLRNKIGLNVGQGRKTKNAYSANHAFRKRVEIIFSKASFEPSFKTYLTNHDMTVSVYHYFKSIDDESLYNEFKKAIPELTVDETERLKQKHELEKQALTQKIPEQFKEKLESIEGQLVEMKKERAGKVLEFYNDLAERKDVDDIEEIKTKLDDVQINEIKEAREILNKKGLDLTPSQDMLRKKYLISKQESIISSLKEELREAEVKVPKSNPKWFKDFESMTHKEILKIHGKSEDNEFSVWADSLEVCEDLKEHIEFAEQHLSELKKRK